MRTPAALRARAAQLREQATLEKDEALASVMRAMADAFERSAQLKETAKDGGAAT